MKTFEISKRNLKNGRRKFKMVLCEVFPDSSIDEENKVGTQYNRNGISWISSYVKKNVDTIPGMFLRAEFLDDDRTELSGHGETGIIDGMPIFENATTIGTFTKGYIEEVETEDGVKEYCIGEGEIDASCYHNFVTKTLKDISKGDTLYGSVEIMKTDDNDGIVYKYGYVDFGRIPTEFQFSGYALLGVQPADDAACLLELNKNTKEDMTTMNDVEIKALVAQTVSEMTAHINEINKCKEECEAKINEANALVEAATSEKNEVIGSSEQIKTALEECREELKQAYEKIDNLYEEMKELREELAKAQAKERVSEMNEAIKEFTEEEKAYAQAEINAFTENPIEAELNSVVNKIWEGIGKKAKEAAVVAEQNAAHEDTVEDIFSEINSASEVEEDDSIF